MSDDATLSDFGSRGEADEGDEDETDGDESDITVDAADTATTGAADTADVVDTADAADTDIERDARGTDSSASTGDDATADRRGNGAAVDAARSTYAWGAYACDRCGADTERVWREEESLVCPQCKSW